MFEKAGQTVQICGMLCICENVKVIIVKGCSRVLPGLASPAMASVVLGTLKVEVVEGTGHPVQIRSKVVRADSVLVIHNVSVQVRTGFLTGQQPEKACSWLLKRYLFALSHTNMASASMISLQVSIRALSMESSFEQYAQNVVMPLMIVNAGKPFSFPQTRCVHLLVPCLIVPCQTPA